MNEFCPCNELMDYQKEQIENWVGDFYHSDFLSAYPTLIKEYTPQLLCLFFQSALEHGGSLNELELTSLAKALQSLGKLEIPDSLQEHVPHLCADFLMDLQNKGRLANGEECALYLKAMKFQKKSTTIKRPGQRLNRNDPCPCGSGKKYKKCCHGLLG
ncbi:MAG: SEC-C domain-containing protein [Planctomycetes bacterium]|nr:SEC-C domain-containing protein [Planctomycetota bacterium]